MNRHTTGLRRGIDVVIAIVLCGFLLFPLYWMVNVSLTKPQNLIQTPPSLFPGDPTLDGYVQAFSTQLPNLITSLVISIGCVILTLAIALPAAFAMAKFRVRGTGVVMFVFLLAQMIPGIVLVTALFAIYNALGLLNTYPGLILADATASVPFAVIILRAFMLGIPDELIEAARIDGASNWRSFVSIVIPLSRNSIVTAGLFSFLFAWADFLNANSLTSGNSIVPFTLGLYRYIGSTTTNWNGIMATAVIASIPAAVLLIVAQRYVAAGVTAGAVKD
ncbi:ABC transporter permease [Rathayibacter sp. AY1G1]|jgi:multiple sugar transport system permease protein|uniref:carbohydrate ABC transporter permease n=1 Tax=unclassified Rathayibacter TaxID=2609250 RepID=UPI000CE72B1A|nr:MULTISPECIES: carbohydrate ABC transporter permease [unclassified Rathayibacter]PPF12296.1 ABC transporter permease [Rathayibacter sp. AY1A5]PPF19491.1 ABC transporter permease [Rathayibacter sp. AY1A4]PPF21316.1 ABC transporter permease [Rathayibacter sp. AY1A7]PPF28931.1 ABC transporter permease [Rathayibacter sp. AY1F2]PPF37740.1 ABC transporter permease [Rathayibacter sp. AY1A3]